MTENGERSSENPTDRERREQREEWFKQISRRVKRFLENGEAPDVYIDEAGNRVAYLMGWSTEHGRRGIFRVSDANDELRVEFLELDPVLPRPIDGSVRITVAKESANTAFAYNVNSETGLTDSHLEVATALLGNASYISPERYQELTEIPNSETVKSE